MNIATPVNPEIVRDLLVDRLAKGPDITVDPDILNHLLRPQREEDAEHDDAHLTGKCAPAFEWCRNFQNAYPQPLFGALETLMQSGFRLPRGRD